MSMRPRPWPEVPADTARVAKKAFRRGALAIRARDELGVWLDDAAFAAAYGVRGAPGISPAQLAMVTVLQFTEDLTDRQAADAVRGRLDWKYCLGLALEDQGFDASVLCEFRDRLVAGGLERQIFDLLLARLTGLGLVTAGGRQRTDSTHVLAAIRGLNRLELAGETVRAALEALAAAAPDWLSTGIDASWAERYASRIETFRLPASQAKRRELAVRYGRDGYLLLGRVYAPGAPGWLRDLPAVAALRRIWVQQYYRDTSERAGKVIWRDPGEHGLPPGSLRIVSPYDTDARASLKRGTCWAGYKTHLSESCSDPADDDPGTGRPAAPNLITGVATTHAAVPGVAMTEPVHDQLERAGVSPGEHALDAGYLSAGQLTAARARGITLLGPLLTGGTGAKGQAPGYTLDAFTIDFGQRQATCPQGVTTGHWRTATQHGHPKITIQFPTATCRACPAKPACAPTTGRGRRLSVHPRPLHEAIRHARAAQTTNEWKRRYHARAGIEGTIHQATHVTGIRRARYRGLPKTRLEHACAAAAINLIRLDAWWTGKPLDRTRTSHLQRLDLAPAARHE